MSTIDIDINVKELRELRRMAEELDAEIEKITDRLKGEMTARDTDTLTGDDWKVTWKSVTTNRLDSVALKKALPEIAEKFTKQSTTRRFVVA